jgi:hypothetical protein
MDYTSNSYYVTVFLLLMCILYNQLDAHKFCFAML